MIIKRRMYGPLYFSIGVGLAFLVLGPSFAADVQQTVQQVPETLVSTQALNVSVDFVETPVSDVAYFVTQQTGIGFIYSLSEPRNINWSQFAMDKEDLVSNFNAALSTVSLGCYPVDDKKMLYVIKSRQNEYSLVRISSIHSKDNIYLMLDDKVYKKDDFPYKLQFTSGSWYALIPSD